jgi:FeS assembly SUF system protein
MGGQGEGESMAIEREKIMDAIRQCYDPEIPINIVDLGLIYDVQSDAVGNVTVKMTLTTQGCPSAQAIPEQVRSLVAAVEEVNDVKVDIVWEPAWNPSMISPEGKVVLGLEV